MANDVANFGYGSSPTQSELEEQARVWREASGAPPNTKWDDETKAWVFLSPDDPEYDPSWGYTDAEGNPRILDPWGDTKEDKWLRSVYKEQKWTIPDRCPEGHRWHQRKKKCVPQPGPDGPDDPGGDDEYSAGEYKYYGTDPHQDWDVDLSYITDAPPFEFEAEPWEAPEEFRYPAFEPLPAYERPAEFSYAPFVAPTAEEVLTEDPGYQFRLGEGLRAMEASAARKGTLLGGATLKGLFDYGSNAASQEYEKAYNRRLQDYSTNLAREQQAYGMNLGAGQWGYGANVKSAQDTYGLQRENAYQNALLAQQNAYNAYVTNYNNMYQQAQDRYRPEFQSWSNQQLAAGQAERAKYDRQWDAYKYAQPSAEAMFMYPGPQV